MESAKDGDRPQKKRLKKNEKFAAFLSKEINKLTYEKIVQFSRARAWSWDNCHGVLVV